MSEVRDNTVRDTGGAAVDQSTRATEVTIEQDDGEDVIAQMQRQLAELEERDRQLEEENRQARSREATERSGRIAAENRAREADLAREREVGAARKTADDDRLSSVTSALSSAEGRMTSLKEAYKAAYADAAADKMADIQGEMALLGAEIVSLQQGKAAIEERRKAEPEAGRDAARRPSEEQQREAFIAQQPALVQTWLRDRGQRFFTDPTFRRQVEAAANYATANKNIQGDSQEFIDFVEQEVGLKPATKPDGKTETGGRNADAGDRRLVTAPAGGGAPGTERVTGGRETSVKLTAAEREQARRDGVPEAEWAKHKLDLINEGLIGPSARQR